MARPIISIIRDLQNYGITLGSVESITGGAFADSVVKTPGVSSFFKGAIVTYSTELKQSLVNVDKKTIELYGVVSSKCAMEMALGGQKKLGVDYCLAFTGNAGPTVQENKAVGDVYIALAYKEELIVEFYNFEGDRNKIRQQAVKKGWEMIDRVLKTQILAYL